MNKLTTEQKKAVNTWIKKYGRRCEDDCQMIDDICHDLDLRACERDIEKIVKLYLATR